MKCSASRRLAVLCTGFTLPIGGCAGTGSGRQKCDSGVGSSPRLILPRWQDTPRIARTRHPTR